MGMYRKLGRNSSQRKALLRAQTTAVLEHSRIFTTEARAKEVRRKIERLITLGIRERDNFEEVSIQAKVPRKDASGKRVKELVDGKRRTVYDTVEKTIKKDKPSRLAARRKILAETYVPVVIEGRRKKDAKKVDLPKKLFEEYGPKYADRKGGYTRIVKVGLRKGDAAMEVLLELV